ncbi:GFA family protein [Bauldia sp.]|uniref:GFA family protein n=1 Tax=Bauldia sp. TaxID=2575872 RepID=UPI003BAA3E00
MADERYTGGCQCGAVRYAITGPLIDPSICHCRMCQKAFGAFYAPLVGAKRSDFTVTRGQIAIFKSSDLAERGFCRDCGTPLTYDYVAADQINVSIGSLDDPSIARPVIQYGLEGRLPWVGDLDGLPGMTTENEDFPHEKIAQTNHQHPDHDTEIWPPEDRA